MTLNLLTLDRRTIAGWTLSVGTVPIISETIPLKPHRLKDGGMRYLRFRAWLDQRVELTVYHSHPSCLAIFPYTPVQALTALVSCHALIVSRDVLLRPG